VNRRHFLLGSLAAALLVRAAVLVRVVAFG
jgi:hypothetical protein